MSDIPPTYGASPSQAPTCPRHPDRPSLIRCQRCERPTCTECQRQAAVGVQCVDCVNDASAHQRATQPRTAVGAVPLAGHPIVTYGIMGIAGVIYALQALGFDSILSTWLMFRPFAALALPWTFITSGFLHGSLMHVALNLWALWAVGQFLERTLGHWRYAAIFLVSVVGGHVAVLGLAPVLSDAWFTGTVGASGGVFGLFGALLVVQRRMGGQATQILVLIGLNLAISFVYENISWQGHVGGLIVGTALVALLFQFRPKATPGADRAALAKKSARWHVGIIVAMVVLLVVIAGIKLYLGINVGAVAPSLI